MCLHLFEMKSVCQVRTPSPECCNHIVIELPIRQGADLYSVNDWNTLYRLAKRLINNIGHLYRTDERKVWKEDSMLLRTLNETSGLFLFARNENHQTRDI